MDAKHHSYFSDFVLGVITIYGYSHKNCQRISLLYEISLIIRLVETGF